MKQLVTFSFGSLLFVISVLLLPSSKLTLELRLQLNGTFSFIIGIHVEPISQDHRKIRRLICASADTFTFQANTMFRTALKFFKALMNKSINIINIRKYDGLGYGNYLY